MSSSYRLELDRWLGQLDVQAERVLDIGGAQLPVKGRTKTWSVKEYLIADLLEPHVNSPKPDIELDMNFSIEPPNSLYRHLAHKFDVVFCLELFDYIFDPISAMRNIGILLAENGVAWVTFPFMYPTHQPIEDDALRYTESGIRKLAEAAGLQVAEVIPRRPETDLLDRFFRAERMRAAKRYDHGVTGWIVRFQK